jgi:hypothetical protein
LFTRPHSAIGDFIVSIEKSDDLLAGMILVT